jgi:uncharacterized membrane protein
MSTETQPQAVRTYLAQLEAALTDVPAEVGREIIMGIGEELAGLDEATAAARIKELGDPEFIAAEARAAIPQASAVAAPAQLPVSERRWYLVVTALLVAVGGYVFPLVGWIVGIGMMWRSRAWFSWEKWVATLAPFVFGGVGSVIFAIANNFGGLTGWHLLILVTFAIPVLVGAWLLWRALRRSSLSGPA